MPNTSNLPLSAANTVNMPTEAFKLNQLGSYDYYRTVLMPVELTCVRTKDFKDGTSQYLVFGTFSGATSREKPSFGTVRASSYDEAFSIVQGRINEEIDSFLNDLSEHLNSNP